MTLHFPRLHRTVTTELAATRPSRAEKRAARAEERERDALFWINQQEYLDGH